MFFNIVYIILYTEFSVKFLSLTMVWSRKKYLSRTTPWRRKESLHEAIQNEVFLLENRK